MRVAFVILQIYFIKFKNIFIFSINLHASPFHILLSLFHCFTPDISSLHAFFSLSLLYLSRLLLSLLLLCLLSTKMTQTPSKINPEIHQNQSPTHGTWFGRR